MNSLSATRHRRACVPFVLLLLLWPGGLFARCDIRPAPQALPAPASGELMIATQNLWRLLDSRTDASADQPVSPEYLEARLDAIAAYVGERLRWPHVLALQEVENLALLDALTRRIRAAGGPVYRAVLIDGLDPSGIDVAALVREPVKVKAVDELFREERHNRAPLFSRPPLVLTLEKPLAMKVVIVHLRSGRHLEDERKGHNVQAKRRRQATLLREWSEQQLAGGWDLVIAGDFNSTHGDLPYAEPITILDAPPLRSVWQRLPEGERFSYVYRCRPQAIDNLLVSGELWPRVERVAVSRGNAGHQHRLYRKEAPWLVSDHDAVGVYLRVGK